MPALYWIIAAIVAALLEMATTALVAHYIALGALAGAAVAAAGGSLEMQLGAFAAVGVVLMALTRPHLQRLLETPPVLMNVHAALGKRAVITEPIQGLLGRGQVRIGSDYWTARLEDEAATADAGVIVTVIAIEGVTAIVRPVEELTDAS
jgi:membrane protein implicated in regulation of membrane protease activity